MPRRSKAYLAAEREELTRCNEVFEYFSVIIPTLQRHGETAIAAEAMRRVSAYKAAKRFRDSELMKQTKREPKGNI